LPGRDHALALGVPLADPPLLQHRARRFKFFNIGVYEPERVAAARDGSGPQLPANHSPLFAPVPKPTIETGVTAMTLAVLSTFDQHARGK